MRFEGRGVVITGGAGGIGQAALQRFSDEGASVFLIDHNEEGLRRAAEGHGDRVTGFVAADVSKGQEVRRAMAAATECLGAIDVVLSNAGVYDVVPFLDLTEERWDEILAVDLKAMFLVGQAAARAMAGGGARLARSSTLRARCLSNRMMGVPTHHESDYGRGVRPRPAV